MAKRRPLPRRTKTDKLLRHIRKDKSISEFGSPNYRKNPSFAGRAYAASMLGDQHPLAEEGDDPAKIEVRMRLADKLKKKYLKESEKALGRKEERFMRIPNMGGAVELKRGYDGPNFGDDAMLERYYKKKYGGRTI